MTVITERDGALATIALNRPQTRNAITGPMADALLSAIRDASTDDGVEAIVLAGNGGAFCSGLDLKAFNADPAPPWLSEFKSTWRQVHRALFECPKPIIGALERYAINGGAALALACDLLVVGESAFLSVGEARLGMGAPYNLAWMRLRLPEATAMRLTLLADRVTGPELLRLGIATQCVEDDQVRACAHALGTELAGFPQGSLPRIKRTIRSLTTDLSADQLFDRAFAESGGGSAPPNLDKGAKVLSN